MSNTVRTFIAIPLDDSIREEAETLQQRLASTGASVKWVETSNIHITLVFLGEVRLLDVPEICRAVEQATSGFAPFEIEVQGVGAFPHVRRPKTIWFGILEGSDQLKQLHDSITDALVAQGGYRREERDYTPHLTVGRCKSDEAAALLRDVLPKHSALSAGRMRVNEVHVLSSELTREGPVYSILGRAELKGNPG